MNPKIKNVLLKLENMSVDPCVDRYLVVPHLGARGHFALY